MKPDQVRGWVFKLYSLHEEISRKLNLSLKRPQISVEPLPEKMLGRWEKEKRLICISLRLVTEGTYENVLYVLKHEMAHQFVDEVLQRQDNRPHGDLFKIACDSLGIDSKASIEFNKTVDRQLLKIEKLLALATSMNQYEAEAALAKAQELSFKYNVDAGSREFLEYNIRPLGEIRQRIPAFEWKIMNILSDFYFVQTLKNYHQEEKSRACLWQFEIYGTSHNIDTAEYVYYFLRNNAEKLWSTFRREQGASVSRMRNSFINGLFDGFSEKLGKEQDALKGKYQLARLEDPALTDFFHKCNPRISRRKVSFSAGTEVYSAGLKEGRKLKVNPGIKNKSSGLSGLFLTDKSM